MKVLDLRAVKDNKEFRVLKDHRELALKGCKARWAFKDPKDLKDLKELVLKEVKVRRVSRDHRVLKELALKVLREFRVDRRACKVHRALKVP